MYNGKIVRKTLSRVGISYFLLMLIYIFAYALLSIIVMLLPNVDPTAEWALWLLNAVALYAIALPCFLLILNALICHKVPAPQKVRVPIGKFLLTCVCCVGAVYVFNYITVTIQTIVSEITGTPVDNALDAMLADSSILWIIFGTCIVAPIGEELLFRKILYDKMGFLGDKWYIIVSGVMFGLFHANFTQLLYAVALGMILAYVYVKTGNIWYPIVIHLVINAMGSIIIPGIAENANEQVEILLGLVIFALMAFAVLMFVVSLVSRKITFKPALGILPKFMAAHTFINVGMLLYFAACAGLIASTFFASELTA